MRQDLIGWSTMGMLIRVLLLALLLAAIFAPNGAALAQDQAADPLLQQGGNDADVWRAVREGARGSVTIPDQNAGILIMGDGFDDRRRAPGRVAALENAGADEHAIHTELHHQRRVGRSGHAAGSKVDNRHASQFLVSRMSS